MKRKSKAVFYYLSEDQSVTIFLGRRQSGGDDFWWIPGGSIEGEENAFTALIREIEEEIVPGPVFRTLLEDAVDSVEPGSIVYQSGNTSYKVFFIPVSEKVLKEEIRILEEFDEIAWFDISKLPSNLSREFVFVEPYLKSEVLGKGIFA